MQQYIDGYVFPISTDKLSVYKEVVKKVAEIWKEHGAINYTENIYDDLSIEGTRSFVDVLASKENETIIFGWIIFESRDARDLAHKKVAEDKRMAEIVSPLTDKTDPIFDAERMAFGGFKPLF